MYVCKVRPGREKLRSCCFSLIYGSLFSCFFGDSTSWDLSFARERNYIRKRKGKTFLLLSPLFCLNFHYCCCSSIVQLGTFQFYGKEAEKRGKFSSFNCSHCEENLLTLSEVVLLTDSHMHDKSQFHSAYFKYVLQYS